ncbi:MAG: TIGR04255 family protein [Bacteroidota bacterium]
MNLPTKIDPCPIIDAIFEVRFTSKMPSSAIFGVIYGQLSSKYPDVHKLPLSQMPEQLRETDPNLMYKPIYKITDGQFIVQIGPKVITISSPPEYIGWKEYSTRIYNCLKSLQQINVVDKVIRIGLRYMNFFDYNIFDDIKMGVMFDSKPITSDNTQIRTELKELSFNCTLQVANKVEISKENIKRNGSIIDIDTFRSERLGKFFSQYKEIIEEAHIAEKTTFFRLFTEEGIQKYNPQY